MKNLVKQEFYNFIHNPLGIICFCGIILIGFFTSPSYILDLEQRKDVIALFDAMIYDSIIWVIVFSMIMTYFIGCSFHSRTINNNVYSGHNRISVFTSKCIIYLLEYNVLLLLFPTIGSVRMYSELGITDDIVSNILHILKVCGFSVILNSTMLSCCIFVVFVCKDIAKSLSISTLVELSCALIVAYGNPLGWFEKFTLLNIIPLQQIRKILVQDSTFSQNIGIFLLGMLLFAFFIVMSEIIFARCELK